MLREAGATFGYEEFLELWSSVSGEFDARASQTLREFSMREVGRAFLSRALPRGASPELADRFVGVYVEEWSKGVRPIPGLPELLARLVARFRLAIVTNTHDSELVPRHLEQLGIARLFESVVTSVEHGFRKPHPTIFTHAAGMLGASVERCIHIGDDLEADYHGAQIAGLRALLIDPARASGVPERARLESVLDLEKWLGVSC